MKIFTKVILVAAFFLVALSQATFSQVPGDYGSIAVGNWTNPNTWGLYNGAIFVGPAPAPGAANNVFITPFNDVTVDVSPQACKNLTVQANAKLWANDAVLNNNKYVTVWGTDLICDGTIGNGASYDNVSFNIDGPSCTISGIGTFDASRIRKESNTNTTTNLLIDMDVQLRFNGTSLTQIYNDAANTNFNVTVGSAVGTSPTLTCVSGNASIDGVDGTGATEWGGSFTVNSVMNVQGKIYVQSLNTLAAYSNKWIINGELKTSEIVSGASGNAKDSLTVNSGGKLNITGTPAFSTLTIPASTNNNFYIFNEGSTVEYSALGNQTVRVSSEFGTVGALIQYYNLLISGSGIKTPNAGLILSTRNDITITNATGAAILSAGTSNINIGGNWTNYNQTGFTEGSLTQLITFVKNANTNANVNQAITCPGGEIFNSMTINKNFNTAIGKYVYLNNDLTVNKQLQFANTDTSCLVLNQHTLNITNINNAATPWSGIVVSSTNNTAGSLHTCRYVVSETAVGNTLYATNPSIIKWTMGTTNPNLVTQVYVFPFGVDTMNRIPIPLTIDKGQVTATTVDVSVATRNSPGSTLTPFDNRPWDDVTGVPQVSSMPSLFVGPNPASDSNTVDRWWEIGASPSPMLVDSIQFAYQGSENTLQPTYRNLPIKAQDWTGTGWAKGITTPCVYCYSGVSAAGTVGLAVLRLDTIGVYQPWVLTSVSHPLPIELLYFTAKLKEGKVDVNWATASEINNEIFYVERSKDGKLFEDIGSRPGAGNSTMNIYYNLVDPQPYSGLSYYRLRQKDYDGKVSYSEMVSIFSKDKGSAWYVFPNPATDVIKIASSGNDDLQNATFGLYSPEGTLIKSIALDAKSQSVMTLDIRDLSKGVYFGRITDDYNQQVFKIVKN